MEAASLTKLTFSKPPVFSSKPLCSLGASFPTTPTFPFSISSSARAALKNVYSKSLASKFASLTVSAFSAADGGGGDELTGGGGGGDGGSSGGEADPKPAVLEGLSPSDVILLYVGGMTCGGCASSVKRILESQPLVLSATVYLEKETAVVWPVDEAKEKEDWQKQIGEKLADHLTTCGFKSRLHGD